MNNDHNRKLVTTKFTDNSAKLFSLSQAKLYLNPAQYAQCYMLEPSEAIKPYSTSMNNDPPIGINLTKVLRREDERCKLPEMTRVTKYEIRELLGRDTFKVNLTEEVPSEANILPGRFVLLYKSCENNEVKFKAQFVIGGHQDKIKN